MICYEIAYDGRVRDTVRASANLLVLQTNNATYERGLQAGQSDQQLAMARLRAIEFGRAVAMASTSGVSAIVAPDGQVTDRAGTWRSATLTQRVPLADGHTLAERVGAWPEALLGGLTLAGIVAWLLRRKLPSQTLPTDVRQAGEDAALAAAPTRSRTSGRWGLAFLSRFETKSLSG